ncbi:Uncharacterised protein [uncultured archaeon]|nr:Uncharacterised protein [uncultured archaeon]
MDNVMHFEIPADSVERCQKFYSEVFGWTINPVPDMEYTILQTAPTDKNGMLKKPGAINGGMMKRKDPILHPVITINVPDIDEYLETIEKMGGKTVMKKMEVGDMGYSAYFRDTEGNIMGLWQMREKE